MDLTQNFMKQAETKRFEAQKKNTVSAIQNALIDLNNALQNAGLDVRYSSGENRKKSEFYIQKTTAKDRPLCIASGTGKGMTPDITITFSKKFPEVSVHSDLAFFTHQFRTDFTHHSNFHFSEETRLGDHLAEKLSALLTTEELEALHTARKNTPQNTLSIISC